MEILRIERDSALAKAIASEESSRRDRQEVCFVLLLFSLLGHSCPATRAPLLMSSCLNSGTLCVCQLKTVQEELALVHVDLERADVQLKQAQVSGCTSETGRSLRHPSF